MFEIQSCECYLQLCRITHMEKFVDRLILDFFGIEMHFLYV